MKQTKWICDICGKPLERNHGGSGDLKIKLKVKQYDGIRSFNFDFTRWTTLDVCDDCRHDMVMWIKFQKEKKEAE